MFKCGQRELDLVKNYTGHDYDQVLGLYYAKARMYDPADRRFISMDPIKGNVMEPMTMVQYLYCINNPLIFIDPLGEKYTLAEGMMAHLIIEAYIEFNYKNAIIDQYAYGVTRTKSGKGRPDVVIEDNNVYHVYEIKSEVYMNKYKSQAWNQINSYINALVNHPDLNSENFPKAATAKPGTILNHWEKKPVILPYLANSKKVVVAWTKSAHPGIIYYEIRDKSKKDEVEKEDFVTESLRTSIRYYALLTCKDYAPKSAEDLVDVDSYKDLELNNDVISFLNRVEAYSGSEIAMIRFPDGVTYYRASYVWEYNNPNALNYNYKTLLKIYRGGDSDWSLSKIDSNGKPIIPILPMPTPVPIPMPAPVPLPLPL